MTDAKGEHDPTLVERWLQEQQEWQKTLLTYVDSMARSEAFLVNLGNAMRGSLLAGKPYPTATTAPPSQTDERLDKLLFALNTLQGQLQDLFMSIEEIRKAVGTAPLEKAAPATPTKAARQTSSRTRKARA